MFRSSVAAAAALFMVGFGATAQADDVKVFHDFFFGYRHEGVDDAACFARQADILDLNEE